MQKKIIKKIVSARFLFPLSTHKTPVHADGLFGIIVLFVTTVVFLNKTIYVFVLLNYSELSSYPKFLLIHRS